MGDEKTRVSACFTEESISHDVSFLLSVNNEDTLHGLVNAYSRCTLSVRTGKLFIAEEDTRYSRGYCELACCNGAACGFICIVPRAKHQPRCGNDLALAALSRCVSPFLPLLPSRSCAVLHCAPRRVAAAGIIGFSRIRICGSWMQEAAGDSISNAVNGKERRGNTSKKEYAPFEEAEQRNLNMRGKQDDNAILIITSP